MSTIIQTSFVALAVLSFGWMSSAHAASDLDGSTSIHASLFGTTPPARDLLTSELLCLAEVSAHTVVVPLVRPPLRSVHFLAGVPLLCVSVGAHERFFMDATTAKVLFSTHD